jgi:hypothetical protein
MLDSWISMEKSFGKFGPQRGWNYRMFPEQNESFLDREALSASVVTFRLRTLGVLAETFWDRPACLDEFRHSLKQYILLGNGTEPTECDGGQLACKTMSNSAWSVATTTSSSGAECDEIRRESASA